MADGVERDVAEFHRLIGQVGPPEPSLEQHARWAGLRRKLIAEEVVELLDAIHAGDLDKIADGVADVIYAVAGTAHIFGIPLAAVWAEVHRSNLTKTPGPTGKAVKGPGYQPPDIAGAIAREMARRAANRDSG